MRSLIVSEFVTLDGVMEAPGGEPTHPHVAACACSPDDRNKLTWQPTDQFTLPSGVLALTFRPA